MIAIYMRQQKVGNLHNTNEKNDLLKIAEILQKDTWGITEHKFLLIQSAARRSLEV